jgi:serine/threonine protein kinase
MKLNFLNGFHLSFDRFMDVEEIGEGGFAKVYSATWIDGKSKYNVKTDGSWKKKEPEPTKVALKRLNGSQNISDKYLNEVRLYIKLVYFIFIV